MCVGTPPLRGGWEGLIITNNKAPKERDLITLSKAHCKKLEIEIFIND